MDQPTTIWCAIMGILFLTFSIHAIEKMRELHRQPNRVHHHIFNRHHLIELGKERDIFFIPGDVKDDENDDYED